MSFIKYYHLESRSWQEVKSLENNLEKRLLSEKHVKGLLMPDQVKDTNDVNMLVYDSANFNVLYKNAVEISKGKTKLFGEHVPEKVGVELVVSASIEDVLELQEYLARSGFEVIEARDIKEATFNFFTQACAPEAIEGYRSMMEQLCLKRYQNIKANFHVSHHVKIRKDRGSSCMGIIFGPIMDVICVRNILLKARLGIPIEGSAISFS